MHLRRVAALQYGMQIEADGDEVDVDPVESTAMGCEPDVMQAETRCYDALPQLDHVTRDGDVLTFTGENVELVFSATLSQVLPQLRVAPVATTRPTILRSRSTRSGASSRQ